MKITTVKIDELTFDIIEEGNQGGHVFIHGDDTDIDNLDVMGVTEFVKQKIYLHKKMNVDLKKRILRHELTHAYLETRGFANDDMDAEQVCDFVSAVSPLIEEIVNKYFSGVNDYE